MLTLSSNFNTTSDVVFVTLNQCFISTTDLIVSILTFIYEMEAKL